MISKFKNNKIDLQKRQQYQTSEIFFECCSLLTQAQYSNHLNYFLFQRRKKFSFITKIKNQCVFYNYKKSVISRFKASRHAFSNNVLTGSMTGFYRAVW